MDQPNCQASIALDARIEAEWRAKFKEYMIDALKKPDYELRSYLEDYASKTGVVTRFLSRVGILREPVRVAACRAVYRTRQR